MSQTFDVAIIGSGIAGSALGAILARHGVRVVIFEAKSHPRFSIGESLILETSEMMRAMADFYDVPELAYFSSENFFPFAGYQHGVKRHFGFLHHQPGQKHDKRRTLQAIIPKEPHGHELHLYRQDTDYFLMSTAVSYNATVLQNTPVTEITITPEQAAITTASGQTYTAKYLVDAGGYRSLLAEKFNLRHQNLQTHSRAIFTHMIDVSLPITDLPGSGYGLPYHMAEGTLHHVFHGGWLWVIPFDNHPRATNPLCSVGLLLDPRLHPVNDAVSPEEEFFTFINQFPDMAAQFQQAKAVRNWVRAGRIQYGASQVVGDRWALLGHAVGFVDPLYSKGLYASLTAVFLLAHLLLKAQKTGDYSRQAFLPLETVSCNFLDTADRLIANSYKAFRHPKLWQAYAVMWLLGAYTELVKLNAMRAQARGSREAYVSQLVTLKLAGGGYDEFDQIARDIDALVTAVNPTDEQDVARTFAQMKARFEAVTWLPSPFQALLAGKTYLPKNKIRLELIKPGAGFMGSGAYRQHFFGDMSLFSFLQYGLREKVRFHPAVLAYRHKRRMTR